MFCCITILLILGISSCKKERALKPTAEQISQSGSDIDVQKISIQVGLTFKILKTAARGYLPMHKYYWICLKEKPDRPKIEALARSIIDETIAKFPGTFHSFVIHFFCEQELQGTPENSKAFAQASFLPDGDWSKVGRVPIDGYKTYQLSINFLEKNK
jgi:hypothetical protein